MTVSSGVSVQDSLRKYADLAVHVGVRLQPGQCLVVRGTVEFRELAQALAESAYRAGASFVDVVYTDDRVDWLRVEHAPKDSLEEYPTWRVKGLSERAEAGAAFVSITGNDPDLHAGQDPERVALIRRVQSENMRPLLAGHFSNMSVAWCVVACATSGWAKRVFPEIENDAERVEKLWEAIFRMCRLDREDPVAAWRSHVADLALRREALTKKAYDALHYSGGGTDFTLGLPKGHVWKGGSDTNSKDTVFVANLPTEEVFSMPDYRRADGVVVATKPLNLGGVLIEDFQLTFEKGRVVDVQAGSGKEALQRLLETDEGASRLGEVALVPHSSPISQFGRLFYNTLFDENASNHLAVGQAYSVCLDGGADMKPEEFQAAGGNMSATHVDFMIGSEKMNVDGILADGSREPVMRDGEWAFEASGE